MTRKGVSNKVNNVRKFANEANGKTCATCGNPIRHGGYPHYCSREHYIAAFKKYKKP
jgi:hypothetical protein